MPPSVPGAILLNQKGEGMRAADRTRGSVALKTLLALLGVAISAVLLSTVFFQWSFDGVGPMLTPRFSLRDFASDLPQHLTWMLPFILLSAAIIPLRAVQWQRALKKKVPLSERYHLVAIGAFANNAVPGKLGDVVRAFLMARTQRLPFISTIGSIAVCKLMETAALMVLVAVTLLGPFGAATESFAGTLRVAIPVLLGLVVLVIALAHFAPNLAAGLHRKGKLHRTQEVLISIGEGLGAARSFRGMFLLLFFSIGPVLAPALGYGLGLQGMGIPGGLFAGPVVLGAIALGQTAIGVPAGLGIYYFVTSWTARSLGASPDDAAAFAVLTHLSTITAQLGVGAFSLWKRKLKLGDLRRQGKEAARELRHVPQDADELLEHQPV